MERAGKALAKLNLSEAISPDQLAFAAWPAAVGERIAAHVWPKALVRGRLILEAEDAVWQKHLLHLSPQVLGKISELLGSGIVTDLAFRRPPPPRAVRRNRRPVTVRALLRTKPTVSKIRECASYTSRLVPWLSAKAPKRHPRENH